MAVKFDIIQPFFNVFLDYWPLILVFWGLLIIFNNNVVRAILSSLLGVFMGVFVLGIIYNVTDYEWEERGYYHESSSVTSSLLSEDYSDEMKSATFKFSAGAAKIIMRDETSDLIKLSAKGKLSDYYLDKDVNGEHVNLRAGLEDNDYDDLFNEEDPNKVEIRLNSNPVWDLDFQLGASSADLDLTAYKVEELKIKTGASETKIMLNNQVPVTRVKVSMGAASLKIKIPAESGCRVSGDMVLMAKDLPGFTEDGNGYYSTPDFENAQEKIYIDIKGGVASFDVIRY